MGETNQKHTVMSPELLIPIGFFATIFGIIYLYLTTRNRERMALIEKGADARMFNTGKGYRGSQVIVSLALLSMGIGVGVLTGGIFEAAGVDDEVAYPASVFIFAGLGLLVSYFINQKRNSGNDDLVG